MLIQGSAMKKILLIGLLLSGCDVCTMGTEDISFTALAGSGPTEYAEELMDQYYKGAKTKKLLKKFTSFSKDDQTTILNTIEKSSVGYKCTREITLPIDSYVALRINNNSSHALLVHATRKGCGKCYCYENCLWGTCFLTGYCSDAVDLETGDFSAYQFDCADPDKRVFVDFVADNAFVVVAKSKEDDTVALCNKFEFGLDGITTQVIEEEEYKDNYSSILEHAVKESVDDTETIYQQSKEGKNLVLLAKQDGRCIDRHELGVRSDLIAGSGDGDTIVSFNKKKKKLSAFERSDVMTTSCSMLLKKLKKVRK